MRINIGCRAFGMTASAGFTHNGCSYVSYIDCRSSQNFNGFNSEVSSHVSYVGCIAGGLSVGNAAYPFKSSTPLGNRGPYGSFILNGDNDALLDGCTATQNSTGVWIQGAKRVLVSGGNFSDNRNYGIHIDKISLPSTKIMGSPILNGNGKAALELPSGRSVAEGRLQAPPFALSGIPMQSPFPFATTVYISGGSVRSILIDGLNTRLNTGAIRLPAGSAITLEYGKPPEWVWVSG